MCCDSCTATNGCIGTCTRCWAKEPRRRRHAAVLPWAVGQAEGGVMLLEQAVCFCCEPRLVAKLDRDSYGPVEKDQRFLQQSQVDLESRRQLQQNGAELRTESAGPLDESVHRLGR